MATQSSVSTLDPRWRSALPDLLAFLTGLTLAWLFQWRVADLVWSLWLASLFTGYALILWMLVARPLVQAVRGRAELRLRWAETPGKETAELALRLLALPFLIVFFTVHFGGFHLVHSIFLNGLFPISPNSLTEWDIPEPAEYLDVLRRFIWFVPLAFIAERHLFRLPPTAACQADSPPPAEGAKTIKRGGDDMMLAYKGVLRLHLLIFFFFFAVIIGLDHFLLYAAVYAVYFFPWRLLRKSGNSRAPQPR